MALDRRPADWYAGGMFKRAVLLAWAALSAAGCSGAVTAVPRVQTAAPHAPTGRPTETARPAPTQTATPDAEPEGCQEPPDDLTRVEVNGHTLSARSLAMLGHAAALYGGEIAIEGPAITQGSYTDAEPASFGTHAGGGAVDLSVILAVRWEILSDEIPRLISALRLAGFAAWLRQPEELGPLSPIHIHAIAIGDPELSEAAEAQLTGPFGYFRGFNGLPQADGVPVPDPHNGPVICQWMLDLGYADLRAGEGD
jgi:hypothetical protein